MLTSLLSRDSGTYAVPPKDLWPICKVKTTTAKPKDCPMDGKTCVEEGNVLAIKSADGPDKCSKRKKYFKNI